MRMKYISKRKVKKMYKLLCFLVHLIIYSMRNDNRQKVMKYFFTAITTYLGDSGERFHYFFVPFLSWHFCYFYCTVISDPATR